MRRKGIESAFVNGYNRIESKHLIGDNGVEIVGDIGTGFPYEMPSFYIKDIFHGKTLSHIAWGQLENKSYGLICHGASDALSLDYRRYEEIYYEALQKAIRDISPAICDAETNKRECIKEFYGHWKWSKNDLDKPVLISALETENPVSLTVMVPNKKSSNNKTIYLLSSNHGVQKAYCLLQRLKTNNYSSRGLGIQIHIPTPVLPPNASISAAQWVSQMLAEQSAKCQAEFKEEARHKNTKEAWIVFSMIYDGQTIWFAVHCASKVGGKIKIPLAEEFIGHWNINYIRLDVHTPDRLLPRAGASEDFQDKKILLVGCGSVGSHVADQLAYAGIGELTLSDYDDFELDNFYRHTLPIYYSGFSKSKSLVSELEYKYPYTNFIDSKTKKLLGFGKETLEKFDLIIIATGNPTHELALNEKLLSEGFCRPVIYTWLEAYGAGGHAVCVDYSVTDSACLGCCYIDFENCSPSLSSHLNFLKPGQSIVKDVGGCGTLFLPYSHLDSVQTAIAATRLALKTLKDGIKETTAISWRGYESDVENNNLKTTHHYERVKNMEPYVIQKDECCGACK